MDDSQQLPIQIVRSLLPGTTISVVEPVEHGGFSDARVYRVSTRAGDYALRSWPGEGLDEDRLQELHRYLAYLARSGLPVAVPLAAGARTWIEIQEECWQLEAWLPGTPQDKSPVSRVRLRNAMQLLAKLHSVSSHYEPSGAGSAWFDVRVGPCPSVKNRRRIVASWTARRLADALHQLAKSSGQVPQLLERVVAAFVVAPEVDAELARLEHEPYPLHPCWRDLWRDHVLYTGDDVTGLIDPNAARTDHVATDLSRLLGSLLGDDRQRWSEALEHYEQLRPLRPIEHRLIAALDRSGVLLSGMYWVERWLRNSQNDRWCDPALVGRLEAIVSRLNRWLPYVP